MRSLSAAATLAAAAPCLAQSSLADVCTAANVQAALPANGTLLGMDLIPSSVTAEALYNVTSTSGGMMRRQASISSSSTTLTYCNVTLAYTHAGSGDVVNLKLAFPAPSDFQNRYYVGGGGGYALSSTATGGLTYGAVGAATDAGYDAFTNNYDAVALKGNGTIDWQNAHMFGYQALGEMTQVAKAIIPGFYGSSNGTKLYTYYEGCSDGGREGMSQVQRWGEEYDGVVVGAPAFRYAQQQVNHVYAAVVEHMMGYLPKPCAFSKIVNATIEACDGLDGREDGVVARTDLCKLNFNLTSLIGQSYHCAAETSSSLGFGFGRKAKRQAQGSTTSSTPEQSGKLTEQDIAVAQTIYDGLHNSKGERAYLYYQLASALGSDANPTYNNASGEWELSIPSTGGEYVAKFIELLNIDNLDSLDGVTYDTVVDWMNTGMVRYLDSLQTTLPDLTPFKTSGGKMIHYHGESDNSVPPASSVHYWQSVRSIMYPDVADADMSDWYQFYLIPGAAHCSTNTLQPGPFPENNMNIMIDWVENGVKPARLNATVQSGAYKGETQMLCQWPQRPLWSGNSTDFECVSDKASIDSWTYEFPAFKMPVY